MIRKTLITVLALALVLMPGISSVIEAANSTSQEASTNAFSCLEIVAKTTDAAVSTITFPMGDPGTVVSNPYNDVDGADDPQVLALSNSEPVIRIYNPTDTRITFGFEISDWTNGVVTSQRFETALTDEKNVDTVERVLSADGKASIASGASAFNGGDYKHIYLEVTLSDQSDITGSSTFTVMGESS